MTNKEMYLQIREKLTDAEEIAFIDTQVAALDRKAAKAKERAALRKATGDEIRETIYGVLTGEFQTLAQIVAAVDIEDFSASKAIPRLNALVELGKVEKEKIKTDNGDKMAYRLVADAE